MRRRSPIEARADVVRRRTDDLEAVETQFGFGGDASQFGGDFEQLVGRFERVRHRQMADPFGERSGIGIATLKPAKVLLGTIRRSERSLMNSGRCWWLQYRG
jgi:hypothetical protein